MSHLWYAYIWKLLPQGTFMSSQRGDFPEDPCSSSSLLNKPHGIYNRVNTLKELKSVVSYCGLVLCVWWSLPAALLDVESQSRCIDPRFLPISNGAIGEAPTCDRSGIHQPTNFLFSFQQCTHKCNAMQLLSGACFYVISIQFHLCSS